MKKGIILTAITVSMLMYVLPSCYKNKEDIQELPKVSFRGDVVPIVVSGGCGCHNNGVASRAVQFSTLDTIYYNAILARVSAFDTMAKFNIHPGGGAVYFKTGEKNIINRWIAEGAKDDGGGCTVSGSITYTNNILPIYSTTCKSSSCHGGLGPVLDYNKLVTKKSTLVSMMNSGGAIGHPAGAISLNSCTVNTFNAWIAQGQPQ